MFAERGTSDEAKEAFRACFAKRKPEYHPAVNAPIELLLHFQGSCTKSHRVDSRGQRLSGVCPERNKAELHTAEIAVASPRAAEIE